MRLLLDEMYPARLAEQLRARGHDAISIHDPTHVRLEGAPDEQVFTAALAEDRVLVTENVPDFRRLEVEALARGQPSPRLAFTTNRQFPRGEPATFGRLVRALDTLLSGQTEITGSIFLRPR